MGAKKMIRWEFRHARDALLTGDYVTLYNEVKNAECARVGKMSRLVVALLLIIVPIKAKITEAFNSNCLMP